MFLSLPMVAISRDLRKPGPTSMVRPCFCPFADRLSFVIRTMDPILMVSNLIANSVDASGTAAFLQIRHFAPRPSPANARPRVDFGRLSEMYAI